MRGIITRISGPVVVADHLRGVKMHEVVRVGEEGLLGEVVQLLDDKAIIQVYEDTTGLSLGEPVESTGNLLNVKLGPGLIGSIFDGIQRPLTDIRNVWGDFIKRGLMPKRLGDQKWLFVPTVKKGDYITGGDIVGYVDETQSLKHLILVPPNIQGEVKWVCKEGEYNVDETVVRLKDGREVKLSQEWPIRVPRPYKFKIGVSEPLITGVRIIDLLLPLAKGGTATIIGGFGTGKTIIQQHLAKFSDVDAVIYVGCGERGNEMTEVLEMFPSLKDPKTGRPMMERTVLVANTSNMPVAAREASIYTGITIAEYFRDMGYNVALMADSTSRWAEALREVSHRLGEIPGEEGYPPYLADRLAEFYERAGRVICLGSEKRVGSVTVVGAVSPPGGDFSEPVTQSTLRVVKTFWALDKSLAEQRHFPAINWSIGYSLYTAMMEEWFKKNVSDEWPKLRGEIADILEKESELLEIVRLIGPDALPPKERLLLYIARIIRESLLMQDSFHPVDMYCPLEKTYLITKTILIYYHTLLKKLDSDLKLEEIRDSKIVEKISRMRYQDLNNVRKTFEEVVEKVEVTTVV
ncbi:MAG TPA: V-type ATP synthase subunit A [Candidatus Bathyarchaeota archaeon]|nr:V-type ATP synthase subunit A [Candidatus Bathyarchaeota archaeon]